jgi:hypothetical protein
MMNDECGMMNEMTSIRNSFIIRLSSFIIFIFIIHYSSFIIPAHAAQDRAGVNAGATLRFSPSARGAAMGDAFTASATGAEAAYYNPAGLGWVPRRSLAFMYQDLVLDVGQGSLGYASPVGAASGWAALLQYVNFGSTQRTVVSGNAGAYSGTFSGRDIALSLSYGARLSEWGYGATAKVYNSEIDNASATAVAADFGLRWQSDDLPVSFGVVAQNLGTAVKYDRVSERLPITLRAGVAWQAVARHLLLTADIEKVVRENWAARVGAEVTLADMFMLRVGYDGSIDIDNGFTFGGGVRVSDFELDYAYIPFGRVGDNHRMGLKYSF